MVFVLTAVAWILRGYLERIIPTIDDTIIAISFAVILFIIPTKKNSVDKTLLVWKDTVKLPWGILLLFGGGMAIASAFTKSGLSLWIADLLINLDGIPLILVILTIVTTINLLTELTSNMATTAMLLPVLVTIALAINVHPYFLLIIAEALPVSEPVPAVVGTAIIGEIFFSSALVQ